MLCHLRVCYIWEETVGRRCCSDALLFFPGKHTICACQSVSTIKLVSFFSQPRYFWFFFLKPSLKQSGHLNTRPNIQLYSSRDCQPGAVISLLTRSCKSSLPILSLLSQWSFIHRVQSTSSQMQATTRPAKDHCTTREKVCGWLWVYVAEKIPFPLPWKLPSKLVAWGGGGECGKEHN